MRRLILVPMLFLGILIGSPSLTKAGFYLGSFENPPNGQDSPDAAVISAILASAVGVTAADLAGLTRIYKNDVDDKSPFNHVESGIAAGSFTVTYTDNDKFNGGIVQDDIPLIIGGLTYQPLFYTAKIDGKNAGFNLYSWDGSATSNDFTNAFYKDELNGLNYTYVDGGAEVTNSWANAAGTLTNFGVSHISVWAVTVLPPPNGGGHPPAVPEPGTLAIWGLIGVLGLGWRMKNRVSR